MSRLLVGLVLTGFSLLAACGGEVESPAAPPRDKSPDPAEEPSAPPAKLTTKPTPVERKATSQLDRPRQTMLDFTEPTKFFSALKLMSAYYQLGVVVSDRARSRNPISSKKGMVKVNSLKEMLDVYAEDFGMTWRLEDDLVFFDLKEPPPPPQMKMYYMNIRLSRAARVVAAMAKHKLVISEQANQLQKVTSSGFTSAMPVEKVLAFLDESFGITWRMEDDTLYIDLNSD